MTQSRRGHPCRAVAGRDAGAGHAGGTLGGDDHEGEKPDLLAWGERLALAGATKSDALIRQGAAQRPARSARPRT
ncbi:MAG TPA: hypothetical protein VLO31_08835 [Cryobacterium sp.]|nr:hypothetical protein [Cryobacterium sp.]